MSERDVHGSRLEIVCGDIAQQPDIEVVVNAANAELRPGGGVAGAIHRAAGPGLDAECRPLAPIRPGEAVITGAHGLPNRHVIHCLGPVYGVDEPAAELLAACYRNALCLAGEQGLRSIAFPAISTGVFGYPKREAAEVALAAVLAELERGTPLELVRFVLAREADVELHAATLARLLAGSGA
jgi:O-acetyl-ADP-ribose deacetylase (regulator of RNase III)